jgi:hypothetical protein
MHYMFKPDESATPTNAQTSSDAGDEIKLIAPKRWAVKVNPSWGQSSFDLHHGLDVSEDEIDTVPAELLNDLFKR